MADLITYATLARWTQNEVADVEADPLAQEIVEKLSDLVKYLGGHPNWVLDSGPDRVPIDVEMVIIQVAKRSYENPNQIVQEGSVGPLGGDRHVDAYALFMDLTETERATITEHNPDGDPRPSGDQGEVFTLATTREAASTLQQTSPLYVSDNLQINLENSQDPRPWMIPLFNPGDFGDDANYED